MSKLGLRDHKRAMIKCSARSVVALAFGLLALAWAMTTPPLGYPDEAGHYLRAMAVGSGEWYGSPNPQVAAPQFSAHIERSCCEPDSALTLHWVALGARVVHVPAYMLPESMPCPLGRGVPPAPCGVQATTRARVGHLTVMGTLEPVPYLLPGLAANLADDPATALRLGRAANALICGLLLTIGVFATIDRGQARLRLLGVAVGVTPAMLFFAGSIAPSATEIAAGFAFFAVLLRLGREDNPSSSIWVCFALTGLALCVSRSLGPIWAVLDICLAATLAGPRAFLRRVSFGRPPIWMWLGVVVAGALSTVWWERTHQPGVSFDPHFFLSRLRPTLADLPRVTRELVGVFGSLDVNMRSWAYIAWDLLAGTLVALALVLGRWRERFVLILAFGLNVVAAEIVSAAVLNQRGFGLQGRHVLAFAVTAPLLAGEIVSRHGARVAARLRFAYLGVVIVATVGIHGSALRAAGLQYSWLTRRSGGPTLPPGGREVWVTVIAVVLAALVAVGIQSMRRELRCRDPEDSRNPGVA